MQQASAPSNRVALYSAAQTRELDRIAMEILGIPGYGLMCRAGQAAFRYLQSTWPQARRLLVLCGTGNNGGDGYVLARLAQEARMEVQVAHMGDLEQVRGDARRALDDMLASGVQPRVFHADMAFAAELIVDALLGTGLQRPVAGGWRELMETVNAADRPLLALDIPSGLNADTGMPMGATLQATATVTFISRKQGLYTGVAADHVGTLRFEDLQVPAQVAARLTPAATLLIAPPLGALGSPRPRSAHKGQHGHVLVVGGEAGMSGAARLAAEAALRSGAGLVSVATRAEHAASLAAVRPELMCHGVESVAALAPLLQRADRVALGPGLGQGVWGEHLFSALLEQQQRPLVVDADALNLLAREPVRRGNWILTPHPGEAARLLDISAAEVQADRFAAVRALVERYGGTVVLKGAGSLIADADAPVTVCDRGNPGMASGGMGDLLTGVIAALWAQGLPARAAAEAGVWLHAAAADRAAQQGERGLLASDVLAQLRAVLNGL